MCANYIPVTRADRMLAFFGVVKDKDSPPIDVFPLGLAPFIRRHEDGSGNRLLEEGHFGLVPHFAKELAFGRKTYNARSETVATLPSFKAAWAGGQRCIIPAEMVFEPRYFGTVERPGPSQRWAIRQPGDVPFGIAGIYRRWRNPANGEQAFTFAILTVSGEGHPVWGLMHKPGEEKRMVLVLHPDDYDAWLACSVEEAPAFFKQWSGPVETFPVPLPPRQRIEDEEQDGLF